MRILIATGGASHSDIAVRLGDKISQEIQGQAVPALLTVIKDESERDHAVAVLARAMSLLKIEGPTIRTFIRVGRVADEIVSLAAEEDFNLIVVGARPQHRLVTRILGPTSERVIAHMPCPVLIARADVDIPINLLVCEGGRGSSLVERLVNRLSPLVQAARDITILHVMSQISAAPGVPGWELRANADELIEKHTPEGELLAKDIEMLKALNTHLIPKVRHGLVVDEILEEARARDYDIIVIGAHQGEMWQRFLLDDLAHQIIMKSDRSVLVV